MRDVLLAAFEDELEKIARMGMIGGRSVFKPPISAPKYLPSTWNSSPAALSHRRSTARAVTKNMKWAPPKPAKPPNVTPLKPAVQGTKGFLSDAKAFTSAVSKVK
jgi:hypothetical protein